MEDSSGYAPRLCFDKTTRDRLTKLFRDAHKGRNLSPAEVEFEVTVILRTLEQYASAIPLYEQFQPESQQRRRERIESLAAHLEGALEQLKNLDSAALGFIAWRAKDEMSKTLGTPNDFPSGLKAAVEAVSWREANISAITAFSLGLRKSASELPQHSLNTSGKDYPWYSLPKELSTAMAVERLFWENNLSFTVSNNGFAAECLRAVFQLGGLHIDRVDYWLRQARDHSDSMSSFNKRMQKRREE